MRHTYATIRIEKGDSLSDVSGQLGHHSVSFTLDRYHHWVPGHRQEEVDGLDNIHVKDAKKKKVCQKALIYEMTG